MERFYTKIHLQLQSSSRLIWKTKLQDNLSKINLQFALAMIVPSRLMLLSKCKLTATSPIVSLADHWQLQGCTTCLGHYLLKSLLRAIRDRISQHNSQLVMLVLSVNQVKSQEDPLHFLLWINFHQALCKELSQQVRSTIAENVILRWVVAVL